MGIVLVRCFNIFHIEIGFSLAVGCFLSEMVNGDFRAYNKSKALTWSCQINPIQKPQILPSPDCFKQLGIGENIVIINYIPYLSPLKEELSLGVDRLNV